MTLLEIFRILLLVLLVICAIGVNVTRRLLPAVIIFMSYSAVMSLIWLLTESPDLAITEAAVGAGVSSILFFLTLRRLRAERQTASAKDASRETDGSAAPAGPSEEVSTAQDARPHVPAGTEGRS